MKKNKKVKKTKLGQALIKALKEVSEGKGNLRKTDVSLSEFNKFEKKKPKKTNSKKVFAKLRRERKFKFLEAIVFDPKGWRVEDYPKHPLYRNEVVYYLGEIPNVGGHCVVVKWNGKTVPMVHPEDFRKAKEDEL